jgi:threonine dehydratase
MNALLRMRDRSALPEHVVAFSSGNHAQAVAWACAQLGIRSTILMPRGTSDVKHRATVAYGAEVEITSNRKIAETRAAELAAAGAFLLPPYDHDDIICGQGTACLEALSDGVEPDAIFAPCGGGGLLSGTWLAASGVAPGAEVWGVEPETANDAARSYRDGTIRRFDAAPRTIADGVRTLALSERTFSYVRRTAGIVEIDEDAILAWTQWLTHLLKVTVEPTAALAMAGAARWLRARATPSVALVILSGGNLSKATRARIWKRDLLREFPA